MPHTLHSVQGTVYPCGVRLRTSAVIWAIRSADCSMRSAEACTSRTMASVIRCPRRISHRLPSRTANIKTAKIVSIRCLLGWLWLAFRLAASLLALAYTRWALTLTSGIGRMTIFALLQGNSVFLQYRIIVMRYFRYRVRALAIARLHLMDPVFKPGDVLLRFNGFGRICGGSPFC